MRIGFVGLGTMGKPMAHNLLKAGYSLVVYNRNPDKVKEFADRNVTIAQTPAAAAAEADILFTMLTDNDAVESVYLGAEGIASECRRGTTANSRRLRIAIDCSTISPAISQKVAIALDESDVEFLDAPVTGSEPQAIEGTLIFMVGGKQEIFEECKPLFQAMGKKAVHMGTYGAGSYTKLANNAMCAINMVAVMEGMVMAKKSGLNPELFLEVISEGGARSGMVELKGRKILNRDFHPQFMTKLMHKDVKLATRLAESLDIPTPVLAAVKEQFQTAISLGYGNEDMCAVIKNYEQWAKIEVGLDVDKS